jgi:PAS domain S-box-containing protein
MSSGSAQGKASFPEQTQIKLDPIRWALQEDNQDWYRDLVEHSRDLLCIHDLQGRLLSVNPVPARLLGYSVEEMLQIPMREMIAPEYRDQFDLYLKQIERDGEAHGLMVVVGRSGERRVWEFHNTLQTAREGAPIVLGLAHDITEKRQAEAKFQELLEAAPDAMVVADADARIVLVNAQVERMFGYQRTELLGQRIEMLVPERLRERQCELRDDFLRTQRGMPTSGKREFVALHKDGHEFALEINLSPLQTAEGVLVTSAIRDITQRKRAEERLRQYEKAMEGLEEMITVVDRDYRYVIANRAFLKYRGMENEQVIGRHIAEILNKGVFETVVKQKLDEAFQGKVVRYEMKYNYRKLGERDLSISYFPIEERGRIDRVAAVIQDITDRKRAEEALRTSEEQFRTMANAIPQLVWMANADGWIFWYNQGWYDYTGTTPQQMEGWGWQSVHDPAELPRVMERWQASIATGEPFEMTFPLRSAAGEFRAFLTRISPIKGASGKVLRWFGTNTEVEEQKRVEEALRRKGEELSEAQRIARLGNWLLDVKNDALTWSEELYRIHGLVPSLPPPSFKELAPRFTPESWSRLCAAREKDSKTGFVQELDLEIVRPDGSKRWVSASGEAVRDSVGRVTGLRGTVQDITERKWAEEALRASEERFRVALKNAPIKVFNQDRELRYTWTHNLWTGWAERDFLGKTDEEIFGPEPAARMKALKQAVLETGEGQREILTFTVHGEISHYDVSVEPLRDAAGKVVGVNSTYMDVTHLQQITEDLRQAKEKLAEEKCYLEQEIDTELGFEEIVGKSPALQNVMEQVRKVAASDATVLLLGETGTGKELVARALHRWSRRAGNSFIKMNCAAIPSGLLESELFGYEKGAFTGAVGKKLGRLELADKGTLFLDEIGEISLALQPKLLRVLQDQEFERLGGTQTLKVDFRLIAATNRDLAESVRKSEFRSDLYYRLNVFPVRVPPLRERREDIPLLVEHFVQKFAKRMNRKITSIPKKTIDALKGWDWPGNVRELENFVERSVILTQGSVLVSPPSELKPPSESAMNETLEAAEREHILRALRESRGKVGGPRGAAARLGLKRTTLQSKLKQMGIDRRPPMAGY